jgi:hypothetical protein
VFDDLERYIKKVVLFAIIGAVVLMVLTFLLGVSIARAHSWYPHECCSSTDCEPLAEDQIKVTSEGYILPNGELVKHGTTRPSQDGQYHWCRHLIEPRMLIRKDPVCLFVPEGGA